MSSQKRNTRNRILKSTYELIESGAGTRMTDIAKKTGITRQALYLHFRTRGELLVAATHYLDEVKNAEERLSKSRRAESGIARLDAFIEAWAAYIPEIYSMAKVMLSLKDSDEDVAKAWEIRMEDMKEGCEAAILALERDGSLSELHSVHEATDILWTLLSVRNWEQLTIACEWTQEHYVRKIKGLAEQLFVQRRNEPKG